MSWVSLLITKKFLKTVKKKKTYPAGVTFKRLFCVAKSDSNVNRGGPSVAGVLLPFVCSEYSGPIVNSESSCNVGRVELLDNKLSGTLTEPEPDELDVDGWIPLPPIELWILCTWFI